MKVIYTYHGIEQTIGGVSRYFYEIYLRLREKCSIDVVTFFLTNIYFRQCLNRPDYFAKNWRRGDNFIRRNTEKFYLWYKIKTEKFDIIHNTEENVDVFNWTQKPIVITIHDMIPELLHQYGEERIVRRRQIIEQASAIICVSENTKKDLLTLYPETDKDKIHVIYHGYNDHKCQYVNHNTFKYILFVGARDMAYKNFLFTVKAISLILKDNNLKLVCTGAAFKQKEKDAFDHLGITERVINVGYVSDTVLANLYHYAEVFIYPSKYEGFGIPIIEAFSNECPICISNTSCFPEVAGDAADYFTPDDAESIRDSVLRVIDNAEYHEELIHKGAERRQRFSWDVAAEKTLAVYKNVVACSKNT